jgi:opacity protein-like surface antigen
MKKILAATMMAGAMAATAAMAGQTAFHLYNRLSVGYDDNIYLRAENEDDSFRLMEQLDVQLNMVLEKTYLSLRYRPTLTWVEGREDDEVDLLHDLTVNLIQDITPRLKLDLSDTLRAGDLPELADENGYIVRQDNDYYYNSALGSLIFQLTPETRVDLSGRYMLLSYDESSVHEFDDYDSWVAGLTLRQLLASRTTVMIDGRYQQVAYDKNPVGFSRDADTIYGGLGLEHTFARELIGTLRGGVQHRMYDDDKAYDDQTEPYVELSLTLMPTTATRFTLTGSYSIQESDISNYLSQERLYCSISMAHQFTTRVGLFLSGSYARGDYDGDYEGPGDPLNPVAKEDVTEDSYAFTARLSYLVAERNWLELNYQFLKLDSDSAARASYSDNRVDLAWKIQIL